MLNENTYAKVEELVDSLGNRRTIKYIRKEPGLMEQADVCETVILTEDNRQVLFG